MITTSEAAKQSGLTPFYIMKLCNQNRIMGAVKREGRWLVPENFTITQLPQGRPKKV